MFWLGTKDYHQFALRNEIEEPHFPHQKYFHPEIHHFGQLFKPFVRHYTTQVAATLRCVALLAAVFRSQHLQSESAVSFH